MEISDLTEGHTIIMNKTPEDTSEEKDRYMPVVRKQDSGEVELVKTQTTHRL